MRSKLLSSLAVVVSMIFSAACTTSPPPVVQEAKVSAATSQRSISNADVRKALASGNNAVIRSMLLGKVYEGKLARTGASSWMADFDDGVYFVCRDQTQMPSDGIVKAVISDYKTLSGGEAEITLSTCNKG